MCALLDVDAMIALLAKAKISKPLSAFLNGQLKDGQAFYDLFAGSCNVISKIDSNRNRYANDMHKELIAMWQYVLSGGELPTEITEAQYQEIKQSQTAPDWLKAFVGFGCSFAGKWWGGYASSGDRNYCANARNSTLKKASTMTGVVFTNGSYKDVVPEPSSMLHCDIPYRNTTGYSTGSFSHGIHRRREHRNVQANGFGELRAQVGSIRQNGGMSGNEEDVVKRQCFFSNT